MRHDLSIPRGLTANKRHRTEAELEEMARVFLADWHAGDRVMTWLRRHEGHGHEFSGMIADGWSWADISRAMHRAGIAYQRTGEPIPATLLCRKAYEARRQVASRSRNADARTAQLIAATGVGHAAGAPSSPSASASVESPASAARVAIQPDTSLPEEPEFRPARLAGWSGRSLQEEGDRPARATATRQSAPAGRADAVISRLMGRT